MRDTPRRVSHTLSENKAFPSASRSRVRESSEPRVRLSKENLTSGLLFKRETDRKAFAVCVVLLSARRVRREAFNIARSRGEGREEKTGGGKPALAL